MGKIMRFDNIRRPDGSVYELEVPDPFIQATDFPGVLRRISGPEEAGELGRQAAERLLKMLACEDEYKEF